MTDADVLSPRRSPRLRKRAARDGDAARAAVEQHAASPAPQRAAQARSGGAAAAPRLPLQTPWRLGAPGCLCHVTQVPAHLAFNPFVHRGYRCGLSTASCVASCCRWHNESLNIWTHAVAAVISLAVLLTPWTPPGAPAVHDALRCLAAAPMLLAFCLSVVYHTFLAHAACSTAPGGAARYHTLLCADVAGVVAVLVLPQGAVLRYGFHTAPVLRTALAAATAFGGLLATGAITAADQTQRALPLAAIVAARLGALALRHFGYGAHCPAAVRGYTVMEALIAVGGAANSAFFPERLFPGRLCYALNSHQIMHLCTTFACLAIYWALREEYRCYAEATGEL